MPGLVRKLLVFSTTDGLIVQSHGPTEHHKSLHIDYKSRRITQWSKPEKHIPGSEPRLESYGIIGLLNIASLSFLIAITGREQVAQIYGKSVYVVTDVALLPLSSQSDANQAIIAAAKATPTDPSTSDSDCSDEEDDRHSVTGADVSSTPMEGDGTYKQSNSSSTSIAKDVANRKGPYGRFASDWFSKQMWNSSKMTNSITNSAEPKSKSSDSNETEKEASAEAAQINSESRADTAENEEIKSEVGVTAYSSTLSLLPKVLRSVKMILSSHSFYFSYEFDLTRRLSLLNGRCQAPGRDMDSNYFYNKRMGAAFTDADQEAFLMPVIQGFVGQRTFAVRSKSRSSSGHEASVSESPAEADSTTTSTGHEEKTFLLTLISRRSTKRSGLRYLRRGIDDDGNCANAAETEQILSSPTWDKDFLIRSFVQVRGSIPVYFSQSPYSFKPVPVFHNTSSANQAAFKRHFDSLKDRYGAVQIATLIDKHGTEVAIGDAYEKTFKALHGAGKLSNVTFEWFDFHAECRGMKFENVQRLVDKMSYNIAGWGETTILHEKVQKTQKGVIRTNCMDCLDRTNVAQSAFGQHVLQRDLEEEGFDIDLLHDESTNWFNILWADNGDAISRQYASTAALKGDFTRTRKRNWRGQVNDLGLTLSRYYSNMVNDYFSQAVIDVLLGNVSWRIFEDFESNMMSADPGVSVASAREAAIENCAKIVIQGQDEDLIHGWALLSPAQENTLRTLPFEETVVLLTDAALYCCKFDWNTEKVASFEKIDLRSISKIRYGTYITSTFTERQMNEDLNQGLVIVFTPGHGDVIRVNTRTLQNRIASDSDETTVDGGTGLLSWFSPKESAGTSRTMALKVMPQDNTLETEDPRSNTRHNTPRVVAETISEEIRRAIEGPKKASSDRGVLESGDIISVADARKRTGYLEQLGHSLKRMVWT